MVHHVTNGLNADWACKRVSSKCFPAIATQICWWLHGRVHHQYVCIYAQKMDMYHTQTARPHLAAHHFYGRMLPPSSVAHACFMPVAFLWLVVASRSFQGTIIVDLWPFQLNLPHSPDETNESTACWASSGTHPRHVWSFLRAAKCIGALHSTYNTKKLMYITLKSPTGPKQPGRGQKNKMSAIKSYTDLMFGSVFGRGLLGILGDSRVDTSRWF